MKKYYGVRRVLSALLTFAMLLVLVPTAAAQESAVNLLRDGSFEKDLWKGESLWVCTASDWDGGAETQTTIDRKGPDGSEAAMLHWWSPTTRRR